MKNPLKFIQEVKQETFRITWPTKKDTMMGAVMVFALASLAAIFFLILDQIFSITRDAPPGVQGVSRNSKLFIEYDFYGLEVSLQVLID